MRFTGKNLTLVCDGLCLAVAELHNQIATCPNAIEYAEDLDELEADIVKFQKLIARIERVQKETT